MNCYDHVVGATFRYQEFLDPSLFDLLGKRVRWTDGEATFELLVERLRNSELSPSQDLVFSDGVFRPFEDAREFLDVCPGLLDKKKRRQACRSVTFAVAFSALVVALFLVFSVLHVFAR